MTARTSTPTQIPMLDPTKNIHLKSDGRPLHAATNLAPSTLLSPHEAFANEHYSENVRRVAADLQKHIGKPYYGNHGFFLYKGDCLQIMHRLAAAKFEVALTVTSPPYNIGKPYEKPQDVDEYIAWCQQWLAAIHRITAPHGTLWLNLGYLEVPGRGLCVPISYLLWNRTLFYLLQEIVWQYGAGVSAKSRFCPRNEKWLFYVRDKARYTFNLDAVRDPNVKYPNQKKNGKLRCNPLGKNPSDVWSFPKVTTGEKRSSRERTGHPAQFPLGVVDRIIKASSNFADVVLDPFSGSASSGIAAVGNGRVYIGIEQREDYCRMSVGRFEEYLAECRSSSQQAPLFPAQR